MCYGREVTVEQSTAPALCWACETSGQLVTIDRRRRWLLSLDLVGFFVLRQAFQLISEQQRMVRRHFKLLAAALASHFVVEAKQVIAELVVFGAIFPALRLPILALGPPHPADAVFVDPLASRTRIFRRSVFRLFLKVRFLVKGHESILLTFYGRSTDVLRMFYGCSTDVLQTRRRWHRNCWVTARGREYLSRIGGLAACR